MPTARKDDLKHLPGDVLSCMNDNGFQPVNRSAMIRMSLALAPARNLNPIEPDLLSALAHLVDLHPDKAFDNSTNAGLLREACKGIRSGVVERIDEIMRPDLDQLTLFAGEEVQLWLDAAAASRRQSQGARARMLLKLRRDIAFANDMFPRPGVHLVDYTTPTGRFWLVTTRVSSHALDPAHFAAMAADPALHRISLTDPVSDEQLAELAYYARLNLIPFASAVHRKLLDGRYHKIVLPDVIQAA